MESKDEEIEILDTDIQNTQTKINQNVNETSTDQKISNTDQTLSEKNGNSIPNQNNNQKNKSGKPYLLIILFVIVLGAILLLPYTGSLFEKLFSKSNEPEVAGEKNTGTLTCTLENEKDKVKYDYTETYEFQDSKVQSLQHVVLIQGDALVLDAKDLQCKTLKAVSENISGVSIQCNLSSDKMVETQLFNFNTLKSKDLNSTFIEAGGVYPNFEQQDNISGIEKDLKLSGYKCRIS